MEEEISIPVLFGKNVQKYRKLAGLTQADFAKRLGTTPKNLSILVRGEQSLSVDIANKLSRMLGTSITFWLNLQQAYDEMTAEFMCMQDLEKESFAPDALVFFLAAHRLGQMVRLVAY